MASARGRLGLAPSLRSYQSSWLRADLIAGLTVWAVLVPESLAYATIAGVSPVVGLYAAPVALAAYALLGSSRHLVVGPMSATAALSAAAVAEVIPAGDPGFVALTAVLAICTGVAALLAGFGRLGFLAGFISEPVLKGFIIGLALTIIVGQLPKLVGIDGGSGDFFEKLWHFLSGLGGIDGPTLAIGLGSLAVLVALKRFVPVVPASLVAALLGILLVAVFGLDDEVDIVGHIPSGLPSVGLPDASFHDYGALAAGAIGVMLVGFAEGLGAAKTYAAKTHDEIDANRELLGLGAANIAAGLASGMVVSGSLSKTAVNGSAGARSQLSGLLVAAMTVLTLLLLTGLFEQLPEATLAAIVIAAVVELVDIAALRRLSRVAVGSGTLVARPDFVAAAAAMLGVLVFDTLPGLFIGIAVSLLLLLYRAAQPHIATLGRVPGVSGQYTDLARHPDNLTLPGVEVLRVDGGLFFANADAVRHRIEQVAHHDGTHAIVLDAEAMPFIDVTAAGMLDELAGSLERMGVQLLIAREIGAVRELVARADPGSTQRVYPSVDDALAALARGTDADVEVHPRG